MFGVWSEQQIHREKKEGNAISVCFGCFQFSMVAFSSLQEASVLGTEEKPLNAQERVLCDLSVLMVHQFHHSFFRLEVCYDHSPRCMVLYEL